ncbi:hypothetical protein U1Q18_036256 [Sarracenia purpurea var. burkii]
MRAGACTIQQTLTSEAASVLKHSLSLARRRGHAQVTPLHVAATLLASSTSRPSLLKRACLKSQPPSPPHQTLISSSHHLHSRALELCFNVALTRLPTTPSPLLHAQPSLSNALIAALKRAQAHQRRGCIEQQQQQQQPLLAIKVELEQLILSILDDPSVSRVMREAGFSSTAVKNNLDQDSSPSSIFQCYTSSSGGPYSSPCSPSQQPDQSTYSGSAVIKPSSFWKTHFLTYNSEPNPLFLFQPQKKLPINSLTDSAGSVKEDIELVLEVLLRKKRRNTVIVGDSVSIPEGLVAELMDRVEKGRDVPHELKSVNFIKLFTSLLPLRFMKREVVDQNLSELKKKVDSLTTGEGGGGGVIVYAGDLKWTVDDKTVNDERGARGEVGLLSNAEGSLSGYNPVDHLVAEIGRLLSNYSNINSKVWLVATANYQTYMKCQMKQPSLEIQWSLQTVSVPSGGLGLSLHTTCGLESRIIYSQNPFQAHEAKPLSGKDEHDKLTCCSECTSKFEKEAGLIKSPQQKPSMYSIKDMDKGSTQLPSWLQSHDTEEKQKDDLVELRRKWNRMCHSQHQGRRIQNHTSSSLFNNQSLNGKSYTHGYTSYPWWPNQSSRSPHSNSISFSHSTSEPYQIVTPLPRFRRQQLCHVQFSFSNGHHKQLRVEPNLDSLKNTDGKEVKITLALGNSQLNIENLVERRNDMCKKLQENVPWQWETIPSIVEALTECKSVKGETWLLIVGNDSIGKRRFARAIAESVLGSADMLVHLKMREREGSRCSDTLETASRDRKNLVVLVEDIDFADTQFSKYLADGFQTGKFGASCQKEGSGDEAIFILTKDDSVSYGSGQDLNYVTHMKLEVSEKLPNSGTLDSDNKRKSNWDLSNKAKGPRIDEKDNAGWIENENKNTKKEFTRQLSSNTLDLNVRADEDDDNEAKNRNFSPISSDLTHETGGDLHIPRGFLESIKNRFVFNRDSNRVGMMKEMVLSKIRTSFETLCENELLDCFLMVEDRLIEEVLVGLGSFLNNLFDKWLKEVFQTSLLKIKIGGKESRRKVRLCFGEGKEDIGIESSGFLGSNLPKEIKVSFLG